ncbi:hypothetical protein CISIN_1g0010602mg, partial [Citrus sinensis]
VSRNAEKARQILVDSLDHVQLSKPLLEALIHFESIQSSPKQIDFLEQLVDKFLMSNSDSPSTANAAEREELSCVFLEFLGLFGDAQLIKKAEDRHARLFLPHRSTSELRKRHAEDFLASERAKMAKSYSGAPSPAQSLMGAYPSSQNPWAAGYGVQPQTWPPATQAQAQQWNQQAAYGAYSAYGSSYPTPQTSVPQNAAYGAYPPAYPAQVGSYFVGQYYQVLQQQPDLVHQFYSDASSMIRVDGDSTESASSMLDIHSLVISLNFTAIEIKTINSLGSWNGGVLVMVSGSVKTKEFCRRRKFVQTFFLAPQEKGYFVLNDIFHFLDEEPVYQHPAPVLSENKFDVQHDASSPIPEQAGLAASDYVLEEEAREYVSSVHIEDDATDNYSLPEQQQDEEPESEEVDEEIPAEEIPASFQTDVSPVQPPPAPAVEEPVDEPQRKTYASILRVSKSQSTSFVATQPSFTKTASTTSDWNPAPQPTTQQSNYTSSFVPESGVSSHMPESGFEAVDDSLGLDEGEVKSVYVRNLPSTVTAFEIEEEFQNFGRIKPDGVFVRNRKDVVGVCYAFVEFEDISGVQNAIQASPIQLAGRQVYIEERRPNTGSTSRGGRRGRGRGSYQTDAPRGRFGGRGLGRGSAQDGGDYNRSRGNGFYQRGSQ